MRFNFFFTVAADNREQREWIDARTADLTQIAQLSVWSDAEHELPNTYHFSGRIDVDARAPDDGRPLVERRIASVLRPQEVGLAWPPGDFEVVQADVPLRGLWLFEDLPAEQQEWLANRGRLSQVTGRDRGFDLVFRDDEDRVWVYQVKSWRPRAEHWRFVSEGLRQYLRRRAPNELEAIERTDKFKHAPEPDESTFLTSE